jgi:hypothetical protein
VFIVTKYTFSIDYIIGLFPEDFSIQIAFEQSTIIAYYIERFLVGRDTNIRWFRNPQIDFLNGFQLNCFLSKNAQRKQEE